MSLMITPAAAASRVSANPAVVTGLAVLFAEVAVLAEWCLLAPGRCAVFVTTISFIIYAVYRIIGRRRVQATC